MEHRIEDFSDLVRVYLDPDIQNETLNQLVWWLPSDQLLLIVDEAITRAKEEGVDMEPIFASSSHAGRSLDILRSVLARLTTVFAVRSFQEVE